MSEKPYKLDVGHDIILRLYFSITASCFEKLLCTQVIYQITHVSIQPLHTAVKLLGKYSIHIDLVWLSWFCCSL